MEIPAEKVVLAQKWMIEKANIAAKPFIISTQVLESMCNRNKPLRHEATDIFMSVLDGADALLL